MDATRKDTANEPVDTADQDDGEFMDTGVLHEPKKKKAVSAEEEQD